MKAKDRDELIRKSLYFRDGVRKIDLVLTYHNNERVLKKSTADLKGVMASDSKEMSEYRNAIKLRKQRAEFETNLELRGICMEEERKEKSGDGKTNYIKIHAPWSVLSRYAEILGLKMPIKISGSEHERLKTLGKVGKQNSLHVEASKMKSVLTKGIQRYMSISAQLVPDENEASNNGNVRTFTHGFLVDKQDKFYIKNRETFFSDAQRSLIVWHIVNRTPFDSVNPTQMIGIDRLIGQYGVYNDLYPLHDWEFPFEGDFDRNSKSSDELERVVTFRDNDGSLSSDIDDNSPLDDEEPTGFPCEGVRKYLYEEWGNLHSWFKPQPLFTIRRYFGDKYGLYFAWLGFYTSMLFPAGVLGAVTFLYGIATMSTSLNIPSQEICNVSGEVGNLTMCPQCDYYCPFWKLHQTCTLSKVTYVFDNPMTIAFTIFMAFWATMCLELWKRRQAVISWQWDLNDFEDVEQLRPEFEAKVKTRRLNPVTQTMEPYLKSWNKALRLLFTHSFIFMMLMLVLISVIAILAYRVSVSATVYAFNRGTFSYSNVKLFVIISAATLNLISIVILNKIYCVVALWLTNLERPRTQTDFEDSYIFKVFLFQCINFYSSLFYVAFIKGKFFRHPGEISEIERTRFEAGEFWSGLQMFKNDVCDPTGCMYELCIQLAIIMIGKQTFNNIIEFIFPKLALLWKQKIYHSMRKSVIGVDTDTTDDADMSASMTDSVTPRWEQDFKLNSLDRLALMEEYLEMVIQYGFVTLFVSAFPLAPLFAFINNMIEIRLDAYKLLTSARRPLAFRAQDIGAWLKILQALTFISIATNALTIALSSDFIPHILYQLVHSTDDSLRGYVLFSLTAFNTSHWGPFTIPITNTSAEVNYANGSIKLPELNNQPMLREYNSLSRAEQLTCESSTCYYGPELSVLRDVSSSTVNGSAKSGHDIKPDYCYFKGQRDEELSDYGLNQTWFHIIAAKLVFVLIFEHLVMGLTALLSAIIPDIPRSVRLQIKREKLLAREILFESELHTHTNDTIHSSTV